MNAACKVGANPAAAISARDGRVVSDPFQPTRR